MANAPGPLSSNVVSASPTIGSSTTTDFGSSSSSSRSPTPFATIGPDLRPFDRVVSGLVGQQWFMQHPAV